MMGLFSPPIPRRSKGRTFRNILRRLSGRRKKFIVKGPRKMRRAWKRNTNYYPNTKKMTKRGRNSVLPQDLNAIGERKYQIMTRLRKRILNEFISGAPSSVISQKSPWGIFLGRKHNGLAPMLYFLTIEMTRLYGIPGPSSFQPSFTDRLIKFSQSLKRLERMIRKLHIVKLLPWKRRPKRKMMFSFEW